ncbi:MAG: replication-associated recombination protein A [Flavobacteriales bacterium]|nr:replication-associated recombination protein A [Flavobacteriales bacterium]
MMPHTPLAERVRPQKLDDYIGQEHILGPGKPLRKSIESGKIPSMILWGPPGVGKTTLARIMANTLKRPFYNLSATDAGVKQVRELIEKAERTRFMGQSQAVLFIDEIHRFNKSQQDSLLKAVENGTITLVGATTENPSFEVNAALLSRSEVFVLRQLEDSALLEVLDRAVHTDDWLKLKQIELVETDALLLASGGDARRLLNNLEQVVLQADSEPIRITNELVRNTIQKRMLRYDKAGEEHYDIISAFIKSVRGSDPNAALYWLARMIEGGEDPVFIARRLLILSSEDIGNANPTALALATSAMQAVQMIGYPESRIILSQITIYLACSPKSNTAYAAIGQAQKTVSDTGSLPVPLHLRNAPTKLMKDLAYGAGYQYAHQFQGNFVPQEFMPEELHGNILYQPGKNPREIAWLKQLGAMWKDFYSYPSDPED